MFSRITRETFLAPPGPIRVSQDSGPSSALKPHDLYVRDPGYPYHRVRMDQPVHNGRVHNPLPYKIQDIRAYHQHHRLRHPHNRASIELRLRRQLQPSLPKRLANTVLVTSRHHQTLLRLVRGSVDEIQQTPRLRRQYRRPRSASLTDQERQPTLPNNPRIRTMTNRTDYKPVRINTNQPVNRLTRKLALEISPPTLKRARSRHLLGQILQHMMRIPVQPVHNIRKIHNNRPRPNNLDLGNRNLKALPRTSRLGNLR